MQLQFGVRLDESGATIHLTALLDPRAVPEFAFWRCGRQIRQLVFAGTTSRIAGSASADLPPDGASMVPAVFC